MTPNRNRVRRVLLVLLLVTIFATLFYSMTALVYFEGDFAGALVVKPYPMFSVVFGGGEEGAWARRHPGQPPPWFMQQDLRTISRFDWEYGIPVWVEVYGWGSLLTMLAWLVLAFAGVLKIARILFARSNPRNRFTTLGMENVSRET